MIYKVLALLKHRKVLVQTKEIMKVEVIISVTAERARAKSGVFVSLSCRAGMLGPGSYCDFKSQIRRVLLHRGRSTYTSERFISSFRIWHIGSK